MNKLKILTEVSLLIPFFIMLGFTDIVEDQVTKYSVGWNFIGSFSFVFLMHVAILTSTFIIKWKMVKHALKLDKAAKKLQPLINKM